MVGTTHIPLNFCWFQPHFQFFVVIYELKYATNGSLIVLRLLPTSWLKKTLWISFPSLILGLIFTIAWMSIVMKLFSLVLCTIMNLLKWLPICQWNCVSLFFYISSNQQFSNIADDCPSPCLKLILSFTPFFHGSNGCWRLHHSIWSRRIAF